MAQENVVKTQGPGDGGKTKGRSPGYPSIPADEALAIAQKAYAAERRFILLPTAVMKHAGFEGCKSGPAIRLMAALKKYGVFESRDGDPVFVHIAESVRPWVLNPNDTKKKQAIMSEMVRRYEEISVALDQYKDGLPDDDALRSYLILERGFTDVGSTEFIGILRKNAELVKLDEQCQNDGMNPNGVSAPPRIAPPGWEGSASTSLCR